MTREIGQEKATKMKMAQNARRPSSSDAQRWTGFSRDDGGDAPATPLDCGTFGETMDTAPV